MAFIPDTIIIFNHPFGFPFTISNLLSENSLLSCFDLMSMNCCRSHIYINNYMLYWRTIKYYICEKSLCMKTYIIIFILYLWMILGQNFLDQKVDLPFVSHPSNPNANILYMPRSSSLKILVCLNLVNFEKPTSFQFLSKTINVANRSLTSVKFWNLKCKKI